MPFWRASALCSASCFHATQVKKPSSWSFHSPSIWIRRLTATENRTRAVPWPVYSSSGPLCSAGPGSREVPSSPKAAVFEGAGCTGAVQRRPGEEHCAGSRPKRGRPGGKCRRPGVWAGGVKEPGSAFDGGRVPVHFQGSEREAPQGGGGGSA